MGEITSTRDRGLREAVPSDASLLLGAGESPYVPAGITSARGRRLPDLPLTPASGTFFGCLREPQKEIPRDDPGDEDDMDQPGQAARGRFSG
jgi:hypothetical protein